MSVFRCLVLNFSFGKGNVIYYVLCKNLNDSVEELSIAQSEFSMFKKNSVPFLELEIEVQALCAENAKHLQSHEML